MALVATGRTLFGLQPTGAAEVRVGVERVQGAGHPLAPQPPRLGQARTDAHGLVDLVGAPPPHLGQRGEHHQAKRVGAQVDDRQ